MEPTQPNRMTKGTTTNTVNQIVYQKPANDRGTISPEIQYEIKRPTLLWSGNVLTRMEPNSAGTNIRAAPYPRPRTFHEARVTPSQMVRTTEEKEVQISVSVGNVLWLTFYDTVNTTKECCLYCCESKLIDDELSLVRQLQSICWRMKRKWNQDLTELTTLLSYVHDEFRS